jgi:potassium/hydrogen antiporter
VMFGGFTFASEVLLGRIAGFYGFSIPEAEKGTSLADFVRVRLRGKPLLGAYISFADIRFVIQDMEGERITKVGLEPKFREPGLTS